ncbi:response regulator, partial [bacterium]|nr:response regulator [bacterium]
IGYQVLTAHHSDEALEIFENADANIDLLLTDIVLPYMSGKELADIITEKNPNLPVLFISGYTANAVVHNGVIDKGVYLLQKPFTPSQLKKAVRDRLNVG